MFYVYTDLLTAVHRKYGLLHLFVHRVIHNSIGFVRLNQLDDFLAVMI